MKQRLLATLLSTLLAAPVWADEFAAAADSEIDTVQATPAIPAAALPKIDLTADLLHQFLVAELAGYRGYMGLSVGTYRDLAKATRDPRVAQRAAEIALHTRQYEAALESARIWAEVAPESQQARQMLASLLAASGRSDELAVHVTKMLAAEGANVGPAMLRLPRIFARNPDKAAVQRLIDQVTAPYLGIAETHFARAVAAFEAQDALRAQAESRRALTLKPDWEQAVLLNAQVTPNRSEIIDSLTRFVADNPKARDARLALARTLVAEKRYEEARKEFNILLASYPDNADVIYAVAVLSLQLNEPGLAEGHLKRLVELGYSESNAARLYLGQIAEERKRWDEAIKWYAQVGAGEQYFQAQLRLAHAFAQSGRIDEARRTLQQATATTPRDRVQLLIAEAQLLREAGRYAEAYAVLEDGLVTQPNQPELLYEAALAAEKAGRIEILERNLRQLIKQNPDHAHALNALGYSLADRNERLEEAQQMIEKALTLQPDDPFILDSKGWVLFRKGDAAGALDALKRAYGMRADPEIAAHLGEVLWSLNRRDEALKTWMDAARANPNNEVLAATLKKFKP
jgi:tetratricopeptide (TPR) repeat protein